MAHCCCWWLFLTCVPDPRLLLCPPLSLESFTSWSLHATQHFSSVFLGSWGQLWEQAVLRLCLALTTLAADWWRNATLIFLFLRCARQFSPEHMSRALKSIQISYFKTVIFFDCFCFFPVLAKGWVRVLSPSYAQCYGQMCGLAAPGQGPSLFVKDHLSPSLTGRHEKLGR